MDCHVYVSRVMTERARGLTGRLISTNGRNGVLMFTGDTGGLRGERDGSIQFGSKGASYFHNPLSHLGWVLSILYMAS